MQRRTERGPRILLLALVVLLLNALVWRIHATREPTDEVVLKLGQTYEQVRHRSGSALPREQGPSAMASVIAKFRFDDPVYGFTTPAAVFLQMGFDADTSRIDSVSLSPQLKPLPLEDAIAIVTELQGKLRHAGWQPFQYSYWRAIEDTPQFRRLIRECKDPMAVWNGGAEYQVTLDVGCFSIPQQPGAERYVITLGLGHPFYKDAADDDAAP